MELADLASLRGRYTDLGLQMKTLAQQKVVDQLAVMRLKREQKKVKEAIRWLEDVVLPDTIA
ncbi:MAG: hypothetical protein ACPG7U_04965 [Holosporaceae bacterium]